MKAPPLFILARTPGTDGLSEFDGVPVVEWTSVCRGMRSNVCFINHNPLVDTSRWTCQPRKRPFVVLDRNWGSLGGSKTLEGALRIARRHLNH